MDEARVVEARVDEARMVHNSPVQSLAFEGITIEGYSRAAVQTYWRIPEWKVGFDLGAHPWDFTGTSTWFISHTHLDHIAALPVYIARRRMMKMDPPTIHLPASAVELVERWLHVIGRLDRGKLPCRLVPVAAGDEYELSRELVVTPAPTRHTITSFGYIVWERRRKLKPEFQGLDGPQIRDLRLGGVEVTAETRIPRLAYLGDSTPEGLDENPDMYRADVLITEVTFVASRHRKERIHKMGHIHLDDIIARREKFQNRLIIAGHMSARYHSEQIQRLVDRRLPDRLDGRLQLWI